MTTTMSRPCGLSGQSGDTPVWPPMLATFTPSRPGCSAWLNADTTRAASAPLSTIGTQTPMAGPTRITSEIS